MAEAAGLVCFGAVVGLCGSLAGVGGGPLLIPLLALHYELPPPTMMATSLCVVFLNTASGSLAYYRLGRIDLVSGTGFGLTTIPAVVAGYFVLANARDRFFDLVLGLLLLVVAAYVTCVARRPPRPPGARPGLLGPRSPRHLVDADGVHYRFAVDELLGNVVGVAIGLVSTVTGIGGGILQVPALAYTLDMPVRIATATAHYITALTTFFALLPLLYFGHADLRLVAYLGAGAVLGAHAGAHLSRRVGTRELMYLLAAMLLATGTGTIAQL